MTESATHALLVQEVILYAERNLGDLSEIVIREDSVHPIRAEKPPRIEGYVPDVFATDVPTTTTLIGEAKTQRDLETIHSRQQISAFLSYLSYTPNGIFVLGVPLAASATAHHLMLEISQPFLTAATQIVILDRPVTAGWCSNHA